MRTDCSADALKCRGTLRVWRPSWRDAVSRHSSTSTARSSAGILLDPHRSSPWNDARWASKLAILLSRDDDYGRALIYAWVELSNLCHEHAYQLTPTIDEVRNLCLTVMTQAAGRPVA